MAKRSSDEVLDIAARLGLVAFAWWTVSIPLQWPSIPGQLIAAEAVAACWLALAIVLQLTRPGR